MPTQSDDALGPVDMLVVGFPDGVPQISGFTQLTQLVEAGTVRVLDFEFVRRDAGVVRVVELSDLPAVAGFDTAFWEGASSHLLGSEDIEALGDDIRDGELALVLLIEQQWLIGLTRSWTDDGARVIAEGGVSPQDLIDALDAAELNEEAS